MRVRIRRNAGAEIVTTPEITTPVLFIVECKLDECPEFFDLVVYDSIEHAVAGTFREIERLGGSFFCDRGQSELFDIVDDAWQDFMYGPEPQTVGCFADLTAYVPIERIDSEAVSADGLTEWQVEIFFHQSLYKSC